MSTDNWTFEEYYLWGKSYPSANNGQNQSPIDIVTGKDLKTCNLLCDIKFSYKEMNCRVKFDTHNRILLNADTNNYINFNNRNYTLSEISIHTPSLHTIDGERYDCEILLIHKSDNFDSGKSDDNGVIVSRLMKRVQTNYGSINDFISQFIYQIPAEPIDFFKTIETKDWGPYKLVNQEKKSFYMYNGSIPYPPCYEKFHVIVYEEIGEICDTFLKIFKNNVDNNIRPIQDLNERTIFYNSGVNITTPASTRDMVSSERFLRCSPRNDYVNESDEEYVEEPYSENDEKDESYDVDTVRKIKLVFLILTILLLAILAYYTVVYMYKQFYVQRLIASFVPKDVLDSVRVDNWKRCSLKTGLFKVVDKPT